MLSAPEVEYILNDSGAKVALVDGASDRPGSGADAPELSTLVCVDSASTDDPRAVEWIEAIAAIPEGVDAPEVSVEPDDVTMILYTGGTTGRQKGVVHTQRSLAVVRDRAHVEIGLQDDERMLIISPLPHATGFMAQAGMLKGATLYIEAGFDAERVLDRIAGDQITFVFMVPTMIYRVLGPHRRDPAGRVVAAHAALRRRAHGAWTNSCAGLEVFGPVFMQLYGQSEAPDFITRLAARTTTRRCLNGSAAAGRRPRSWRWPWSTPTGHPLVAGEVGQVVARGPLRHAGLPQHAAKDRRNAA